MHCSCAPVFVEFTALHFGAKELDVLLGDVLSHVISYKDQSKLSIQLLKNESNQSKSSNLLQRIDTRIASIQQQQKPATTASDPISDQSKVNKTGCTTTQLYTKNSFFMHFVYNFGEKFNILKIFCEIDPWIEMMDMSWSVRTLLRSWPADLRSRLGLWLIRNSWRSPWYMCSKIMHWGSSWNYDLHGQNST